MVVSAVAGCCGCLLLALATSLPFSIRVYAWGIVIFPILLFYVSVTLFPPLDKEHFLLLLCFFPLYCFIPQFLIARWLANETKGDIIEPDWEEEKRLL